MNLRYQKNLIKTNGAYYIVVDRETGVKAK